MTRFLVCECGWKSKAFPNDAVFVGLGGNLSCPECTKHKRNKGIEVYGSVHIEDEWGNIVCTSCGNLFAGVGNRSPIPDMCMNCWLRMQTRLEKLKKKHKKECDKK